MKNMTLSSSNLKNALSKRFGEDNVEAAWDYLDSYGFVDDAKTKDNLDEGTKCLIDEYRKGANAFGGNNRRKQTVSRNEEGKGIDSDERLKILEAFMAREAAQNAFVRSFRREHLYGRLIEWYEVAAWIETQSRLDGSPTQYVTYAIPEGHQFDTGVDVKPLVGIKPVPRRKEVLSYQIPDVEITDDEGVIRSVSQGVRVLPIACDGVLGNLLRISELLADSYEWTPSQSTVFILTGIAPAYSRGRVFINHRDTNWKTRITIEVEPTVSPKEVAKLYREARSDLGLLRGKPMSSKHLRLAEYYGAKETNSLTREKLMKEWNSVHAIKTKKEDGTVETDETYSNVTNFARDCLHAWRRVIGIPIGKASSDKVDFKLSDE